MRSALPILFWLIAIIHIIPAVSGVSGARLANLYGIEQGNETFMTLLQHRAVLFGFVGAACIYAAHNPPARWAVLIGAVIAMASFIIIAALRGATSGALSKIIIVDAIGLVIAALAAILLIKGS
jgi:hypothetical protein